MQQHREMRFLGTSSENTNGCDTERFPNRSVRSLSDEVRKKTDTAAATVSNVRPLQTVAQTARKARKSAIKLLADPFTLDIESHHTLITPSGRVKLLHRPEGDVRTAWDERRQRDEDVMQDTERLRALELSHQNVEAVKSDDDDEDGDVFARYAEPTCAVEFDAVDIVVTNSEEQHVTYTSAVVRRAGDSAGTLKCKWEIERGGLDSTMYNKLGVYQGEVSFEDGESAVKVKLPVPKRLGWNLETFYFVKLHSLEPDPEAAFQRPVLGRNWKVTVYSLNMHPFPANSDNTSLRQLVYGFLLYNFSHFPSTSAKGLMLAMYPAVEFAMTNKILENLVECGGSAECTFFGVKFGNDWQATPMAVLVGLQALVFVFSFISDRSFRLLRLEGKSKRLIRKTIFAALMQLTAEAKEDYDDGDIPKIMDTEVERAVKDCWLGIFRLTGQFSQLLLGLALVWQVAISAGQFFVKVVLFFSVVIIMLAAILMLFTSTVTEFTLHRDAEYAEQNWHEFVRLFEACTSLVVPYHQADATVMSVDKVHQQLNKVVCKALDGEMIRYWLLKVAFLVVRGVVMLTTGVAARGGRLHVGQFVVVNKVVNDFSILAVICTKTTLTIFTGAVAVKTIADVLNKDTIRRMQQKQDQRHKAYEQLSFQRAEAAIVLDKVEYWYASSTGDLKQAVQPISGRIDPNQLVCLPRHNTEENRCVGMDTFFKLLSKRLLPTRGVLRMPSRWRTIYVPVMPILFDGTLMFNLAYCNLVTHGEIPKESVWAACQAMGMSPELIGDEDFDVGANGARLKLSDRLIVSLVRALLFDSEVLLVSSVLDVLGMQHGRRILRYLRRYIREMGLPGMRHPLPKHLRHRKTVIYATKFLELQEGICDQIVTFTDVFGV